MNKENELKENEVEQPREPLKQQHRYLNSETLTKEEIIQREIDIKKLSEMYPRLPTDWLSMAWNYCHKTPIEEQNKVISGRLWDKPIERFKGGEIIGFDVIPKTSEEEKQTEEIQKLKLDLEENEGEEDFNEA